MTRPIGLIDTHCHIHDIGFFDNPNQVYEQSLNNGILGMICVGTDAKSSAESQKFAAVREHAWCSVGLHPHEAKNWQVELPVIESLVNLDRVVAVGEIGLDYYYLNSSRQAQLKAFKVQLRLACANNLPVILHIRSSKTSPTDAFEDAFKLIDEFAGVRGVVHSFSGGVQLMRDIVGRGLAVGINGIVTFCRDDLVYEMVANIPLDRLLLETDAPYLTPEPFRGTINMPEHVRLVAEYVAKLRREAPIAEIVHASTNNAKQLFGI